MKRDQWNRCDVCGKFIPIDYFQRYGPALRRLLTPDAEGTRETWETLCAEHARDKLEWILLHEENCPECKGQGITYDGNEIHSCRNCNEGKIFIWPTEENQ